jgi:type II secretory pathway predicted ATPase ExeA/DNA-binding MarR family transcriptional regulator
MEEKNDKNLENFEEIIEERIENIESGKNIDEIKYHEKDIKDEKKEQNDEKIEEKPKTAALDKKTSKKWLSEMRWSSNPFIFAINPQLFVGYKKQVEQIKSFIYEGHKICMVLGPTGSGKTTFLKHIEEILPSDFKTIFISKPPKAESDFVWIFNEKFHKKFLWWNSNIKNIHQISDFLNRKLGKKKLAVFYDEIHEADTDVLEWLRVLSDHTENMCVILAGLPVFEDQLADRLETLRKRIAVKISLVSLTKEETREMIIKRIQAAGGSGREFTEEALNLVYEHSGGFPREILRICDILVQNAIKQDRKTITPDLMKTEKPSREKTISLDMLQSFTPMQRQVLEMLSKHKMSPGDIADRLELEKYRSRQHAVRSVNNILKRLMQDGFLEREKTEKAFIYKITPRLKTIFVKA